MYRFLVGDDAQNVREMLLATEHNEMYIDVFCKNRALVTKSARFLFPFAIKFFKRQDYSIVSLKTTPMSKPFYESYGFIKSPYNEEWIFDVSMVPAPEKELESEDKDEECTVKRQHIGGHPLKMNII